MNIKQKLLAVAIAGAATVAYSFDASHSALGEAYYSASYAQPVGYFDESEGSQSASNTTTWFFPDGSIAYDTRDTDGTVLWVHADGMVVRDKGMGEITWWQPDGIRIEQKAPTLANLSNTLTWFFPDGSIAYDDRDRDGSVLWVHADGLVERDKGFGEITWWQPDGTRIEQNASTVATWYFPDGTVLSESVPGVVAIHYPDGRVTYQDGIS